jgi:hypothetical protein
VNAGGLNNGDETSDSIAELGKLGKEAENEGPVQHWPDKELFGNG